MSVKKTKIYVFSDLWDITTFIRWNYQQLILLTFKGGLVLMQQRLDTLLIGIAEKLVIKSVVQAKPKRNRQKTNQYY